MKNSVLDTLKRLRLSGMARSMELRLQEARGNSLTAEEFLELILQDELHVRGERLIARRLKAACFRELKTLDDFDWRFNTSIKRKTIYELATGQFVRERKDVLLIGPPGVGKSHICQAIGYEVIKAGSLVLYRSIFDLVRDFMRDEALGGEERILTRYLKPDLLLIDLC